MTINNSTSNEKHTYSRPIVKKMLSVGSDPCIKLIDTHVKRTLDSLYYLDVVLFFITNEELASQENEKVAERLQNHISAVEKSIASYEYRLEKAGEEVNDDSFGWSINKTVEYNIHSPLSAKYMKFVALADKEAEVMARIWLLGVDSNKGMYAKKLRAITRKLQQVSQELINYSLRAKQAVNQLNQTQKEALESTLTELNVQSPTDDQVEVEKAEPEENEELSSTKTTKSDTAA